jgi:hypothetical protein
MVTKLRCDHGECAIGVYDAVTVLTDGHAWSTSGAAVRDTAPADECYRLACYTVVARSAGWRDNGPRRRAGGRALAEGHMDAKRHHHLSIGRNIS